MNIGYARVSMLSQELILPENIDTTTSGGKLAFHIFGTLAKFEMDCFATLAKTIGCKAFK